MFQNFSKNHLHKFFFLSNWKNEVSVFGLIFVRLAQKILFGKKEILFWVNCPHFAKISAFFA